MTLKKRYFTVSGASKQLGVSRQTISRWIAQGKLTTETVGREKLIEKKQVLAIELPKFTKEIMGSIADILKQSYYSEDDQIRVVGDEFIVTKSDGTMEKIKVAKITTGIDAKTKVPVLQLTEIIRTPYKKGGNKKE